MSTDVIPNKCLQYIINIVHICYFNIKIIFFCPFLNAYYSYKIKRIFQPTFGDAYYTQGLTLHETSWYIFILLVKKKTTLLHKSIEHAIYWRIHESLGLDSFSIRTKQENPIILTLNFSEQFELYQWQLQWLHVKSGPTVG